MKRLILLSICLGALSLLVPICSKFVPALAPAAPATLTLFGTGMIRRQPERGTVVVTVRMEAPTVQEATQRVTETTQLIQAKLRALARRDEQGRAPANASVTRWSSSGLLTNTWVADSYEDRDGNQVDYWNFRHENEDGRYRHVGRRRFQASVEMTARFRDFDALSAFSLDAATTPLVSVGEVSWALSAETMAALQGEAIARAYEHVHAKAAAYARAAGYRSVKALKIDEEGTSSDGYSGRRYAPYDGAEDIILMSSDGMEPTDEPSLSYVPRDLEYKAECQVKFAMI